MLITVILNVSTLLLKMGPNFDLWPSYKSRKHFLAIFIDLFGLAYSPLNSAKLSCSSEVSLIYILEWVWKRKWELLSYNFNLLHNYIYVKCRRQWHFKWINIYLHYTWIHPTFRYVLMYPPMTFWKGTYGIAQNVIARTYLQLPLRQWGAGNVYLLVLSSWKVNMTENSIAVIRL